MAAANTDKFRKMKSQFSTTLASGITDSDTTIPCNSLAGVPTGTAVTLTIDRVDANGTATPDKQERVVGVVSTNSLTNCLRNVDGDTAQVHSAGAVVEMIWDADTWNDALDGVLAEHSQAGAHTTDTIAEKTAGAGVTIDGLLIKDGGLVDWDGWIEDSNEWTYTSWADTNGESTLVVEVASDARLKYQAGMRVKFTQDATVKQGIITLVAETALTIFVNTDYTGTANAITLPYYSLMKVPFGFDISPSNYSVIKTDTTDRSQGSPTQNTWYNLGSQSITVPIGSWDVDYSVDADLLIAAGSAADKYLLIQTTLSKANDSEDDEEFTATFGQINSTSASAVFTNRTNLQKRKLVEITASDVYYLNTRTTEAGITTIRNLNGTLEPSIIRARLTYL